MIMAAGCQATRFQHHNEAACVINIKGLQVVDARSNEFNAMFIEVVGLYIYFHITRFEVTAAMLAVFDPWIKEGTDLVLCDGPRHVSGSDWWFDKGSWVSQCKTYDTSLGDSTSSSNSLYSVFFISNHYIEPTEFEIQEMVETLSMCGLAAMGGVVITLGAGIASESISSQQTAYLSPSSKVSFKYEDNIIAFNSVVALLEHSDELYQPMLSFLSNCCISTAITIQHSAIYSKYLKEFCYTAVQKSVENLLKESSADVNLDADESPYDTQSEFKMVKRFQPAQANDTFEGSSSDNIGVHPHQDLSKFKEKDANDMIDELVILAANVTLHAFANKLILSDPLSHLLEEIASLDN
ncbi:hypothetical protein Tco_1210402 [Tanacetum coccineum]